MQSMINHYFSTHWPQISILAIFMRWDPKEILEEMRRLDEESAEIIFSIVT